MTPESKQHKAFHDQLLPFIPKRCFKLSCNVAFRPLADATPGARIISLQLGDVYQTYPPLNAGDTVAVTAGGTL